MVETHLTADIDEAARVLSRGGLVAFPTETVYGLGADARSAQALRRLFAAKGRPEDHPVIVHIGRADELTDWTAVVPEEAELLAKAFWPGPLTMILPRATDVSHLVTGGQETVGVRMPDHPVALELLRSFGGGIAAPSANRFGRLSPTRPEHVLSELDGRVDLVLTGEPSRVGLESTIVNLTGDTPVILRPGHIRPDEIAAALGRPVSIADAPGDVRSAGMLPSHYAPSTPLTVLASDQVDRAARERRVAVLARREAPAHLTEGAHWLHAPASPVDYARDLYASLRTLDRLGADEIIVEEVPDAPAWVAIADRLRRAAAR